MGPLHHGDKGLSRMAVQGTGGLLSGSGGFLAMTDSVDDAQKNPAGMGPDETMIARLLLPRHHLRGAGPFYGRILSARKIHDTHFLIVTRVPRPTVDWTSNSSMSRFAPGR